MVSQIKLRRDPKDRLAVVFGGGMQIATSTYHAYNHGLVLTVRIVFQARWSDFGGGFVIVDAEPLELG
jgi:hypothetical protein